MTAMDGYKGRKAPNVSQYLANLNALPSAHDLATQQQEDFSIDDELAQFTNTEFLDFDAGDFLDQARPEYDPSLEEKARRENAVANNKFGGKGMDFVNGMLRMLHIALDCSQRLFPCQQSSIAFIMHRWPPPKKESHIHDSTLTQFHQPTSPSPA